eukprot:scaffold2353_cov167-Amphora_coffeaeformis.AAC.19
MKLNLVTPLPIAVVRDIFDQRYHHWIFFDTLITRRRMIRRTVGNDFDVASRNTVTHQVERFLGLVVVVTIG